jgi:hypothetical protein
MARPRFTIARVMAATAVFAVNAALLRAFLVQEMFYGAIVAIVVLQAGVVALVRSRGRARGFWVGFEAFGVLAILALFSCELFPEMAVARALMAYINFAIKLVASLLPAWVADELIDNHQNGLLVAVYALPELAAALLGGVLGACWVGFRSRGQRPNGVAARMIDASSLGS